MDEGERRRELRRRLALMRASPDWTDALQGSGEVVVALEDDPTSDVLAQVAAKGAGTVLVTPGEGEQLCVLRLRAPREQECETEVELGGCASVGLLAGVAALASGCDLTVTCEGVSLLLEVIDDGAEVRIPLEWGEDASGEAGRS